MADQKVSALTGLTAPVDEDLLYVVDDPAGVPTSKKITKADLTDRDHAQIYVTGGATPQTITTGGTYEKFVGFTTDGPAKGAVAAAASDKITLTKAGVYLVQIQISFQGTNNAVVNVRARWNGVDQDQIHLRRKLGDGGGGDIGSASCVGLLDATVAGVDLELWFTTDGNGDDITALEAQLVAIRIAQT